MHPGCFTRPTATIFTRPPVNSSMQPAVHSCTIDRPAQSTNQGSTSLELGDVAEEPFDVERLVTLGRLDDGHCMLGLVEEVPLDLGLGGGSGGGKDEDYGQEEGYGAG